MGEDFIISFSATPGMLMVWSLIPEGTIVVRVSLVKGHFVPTKLKFLPVAYKSPIGSTPFRIVYGKACHLPIEMGHKSYWALKNVNLDLDVAGRNSLLQLNKLAKMRNKAYEHSCMYKERTQRWHDARILAKEYQEGEEVLVVNSRLKIFPGKLKTRWYGPYTVSREFPYGR
ncbi:hypothetical protein Tco_0282547 [Tanacetum coccineum]